MAIATADERVPLLVRRAELFLTVDRTDRAAESAREALYAGAPEPYASRAHVVIGAVALSREDLTMARAELEPVAARSPGSPSARAAHALLALVEERAGRRREAEAHRALAGAADAAMDEVLKPFTREPAAPSVAAASPLEPKVIPRAQWHAARTGPEVDPMGTPRRITVHHEGKEFYGTTVGDALREVRNIQSSHQHVNHWADIGYHYVIDPTGAVIEGRPMSLQGAHAGQKDKAGKSPNEGNIGISLLGDFNKQRPTSAQLRSLEQLVAYLRNRYKIPTQEIWTHNEIRLRFGLAATACPGKNLRGIVEEMRTSPAVSD